MIQDANAEALVRASLDILPQYLDNGEISLKSIFILAIVPAFVNFTFDHEGIVLGIPRLRLVSMIISTDAERYQVSFGLYTCSIMNELLNHVGCAMTAIADLGSTTTVKMLTAVYNLRTIILLLKDLPDQLNSDIKDLDSTIRYSKHFAGKFDFCIHILSISTKPMKWFHSESKAHWK